MKNRSSRACVEGGDRRELVRALCETSYTHGEYAPNWAEGRTVSI